MTKFKFEWSNGEEIVEGDSIIDACKKIKTPISEIKTGHLVRCKIIREQGIKIKGSTKWAYWDSRMFLKCIADIALQKSNRKRDRDSD